MDDKIHYFWTITDEVTKRRFKTRHRMTEKTAFERHGADAQKVPGPGEVFRDIGQTGDWLNKPPKQ
jgi:hypothetical protein